MPKKRKGWSSWRRMPRATHYSRDGTVRSMCGRATLAVLDGDVFVPRERMRQLRALEVCDHCQHAVPLQAPLDPLTPHRAATARVHGSPSSGGSWSFWRASPA